MPKVSVIIPAYNAMSYLPETLESVLQQTFTDFEVIIVNDGSSDHIVQWVSSLLDDRIRLISQSNQGVSTARNTAIGEAKGEYISFLDADDLWRPTKLEKQVQFLDNNPIVGLVATWLILIDEHNHRLSEIKLNFEQGNISKELIENNFIPCGSIPMVRRVCFEKVGVFDPTLRFGEDWEMWTRVAADYDFGLVKELLVCYRQHSKNSSKNHQEILPDFDRLIEKMFSSASAELLPIKEKTYGRMNLYIAWKSLENKDYRDANKFCDRAIEYYPQLKYTKNYLQLKTLILLKSRLNTDIYKKFKNVFNVLKQQR